MNRTRRPVRLAGLMLAAALALPGCELKGETVSEVCERMGDRCRVRDGVLGVCSEDPTASCPTPPCLRCVGQH